VGFGLNQSGRFLLSSLLFSSLFSASEFADEASNAIRP
jgi:hypothetical protein